MSLGPHPHPRYRGTVVVELDVELGAPSPEAARERVETIAGVIAERFKGRLTSQGRYFLGKPLVTAARSTVPIVNEVSP